MLTLEARLFTLTSGYQNARLFDGYDRIRIINLPARRDRRREMIQELNRVALATDSRVAFVEAVQPSEAAPWRGIGESGCFRNHLAILQNAALAGESVLILEDDADFTSAVLAPQPDSDILWGGYTRRPEDRMEGTHCMGFSAEAVKRAVPFLENMLSASSPPPIDGAYVEFLRQNSDLTVHLCDPMVALQRPSLSDIAGPNKFHRYVFARPLFTFLRRFKREWQRHSQARYQTSIKPYKTKRSG